MGIFNPSQGLGDFYINSADNTTQTVSMANVFQPITFAFNLTIAGWVQAGGDFTSTQTGIYLVSYRCLCHRTAGTPIFEGRCFDITASAEIIGSQTSQTLSANNPDGIMGAAFIIDRNVTVPNIRFQFTATVTTANIAPAGGSGASPIGAEAIIHRIA